MKIKKKIITIGGGGFTHNQDNDQDQFILNHINKKNSSLGFLPIASNDDSNKTKLFYKRFEDLDLNVSHFNLISGLKGFENWISKKTPHSLKKQKSASHGFLGFSIFLC